MSKFFNKLLHKATKSKEPAPAQSVGPKLHSPNPNPSPPKGILRNKADTFPPHADAYPASDDIDESLRNAQKNSSLNQSMYTTPQSVSPQKIEAGSDEALKDQKDVRWDEANLEKNEEEKVPRMKIDEPPTPYNAEFPEELRDTQEQEEMYIGGDDDEEIILDENPMDTSSVDGSEERDKQPAQTLEQQQQSLLLGDEAYRARMVQDALNRRTEETSDAKKKMPTSAWEADANTADSGDASYEAEPVEDPEKAASFRKKRKAHYNEFHAIRAWKTKNAEEQDDT